MRMSGFRFSTQPVVPDIPTEGCSCWGVSPPWQQLWQTNNTSNLGERDLMMQAPGGVPVSFPQPRPPRQPLSSQSHRPLRHKLCHARNSPLLPAVLISDDGGHSSRPATAVTLRGSGLGVASAGSNHHEHSPRVQAAPHSS